MSRADGRRVEKMSDDKEVGFYNVHDGVKGRDGGPYLDHIERQAAEVSRARLEGREPADPWGVLPATAGSPLLVASQIIDNSWTSNPSMAAKPHLAAVLDDEKLGKGKPHGELSDASFASPVSKAVLTPLEEETEPAHPNVTDTAPEGEQTLVSSDGHPSTVPEHDVPEQRTEPDPMNTDTTPDGHEQI